MRGVINMLKDVLEFMVKSLVNEPEKVTIDQVDTDEKINISVAVDQQDIGKVIGKEGRTIKALRVYVASLGSPERPVYIELKK